MDDVSLTVTQEPIWKGLHPDFPQKCTICGKGVTRFVTGSVITYGCGRQYTYAESVDEWAQTELCSSVAPPDMKLQLPGKETLPESDQVETPDNGWELAPGPHPVSLNAAIEQTIKFCFMQYARSNNMAIFVPPNVIKGMAFALENMLKTGTVPA